MKPHEDAPPKRRGGRPNTGKRGTFTFRVTDTLRQKLEEQAAASGRPVSEEIEMALEASFLRPSPHSGPVLALLGATIGLVENLMGGTWRDERIAVEVRAAVDEVLNKYIPVGAPDASGSAAERISAALLRGAGGRAVARSLTGDVGSPDEAMAGVIHMSRVRAENDPTFREKLEDYLRKTSDEG